MTSDETPDRADATLPSPLAHGRRLRYQRLDRGLEFARVANFSDAVYAIALTLIAVELRPPVLAVEGDAAALLDKLGGMYDEITIFFIAFAVLGSYWLANHRFMAGLRGVDSAYVFWVMPYLAFVAFLPFPAALLGRYPDNPVAVSVFAIVVAVISFLEWVLLVRAHVSDLFLVRLSASQYRWASMGSMSPVVIFLLSVPVMWINTLLGMAFWALNIPVGIWLGRHEPPPEDEDTAGAAEA